VEYVAAKGSKALQQAKPGTDILQAERTAHVIVKCRLCELQVTL
jgi:hypothetical protein